MNQEFTRCVETVVANIRQVVVANPDVIKLSLLGLFCQGHILLDDLPGVGKTLLAKSLAKSVQGSFKRIQFTPDLLPTDITGSSIYNQSSGDFKFIPGPIFANIVLADEINRSSPRTQSALLEAMGEGYVTFDGTTYPLPRPFFVIATRNFSESHGVFPLPQSQLDRFLLSFGIGYPGQAEEVEILERHEQGEPQISSVITAEDVSAMQRQVLQVKVARPVKEYIARIIAETRSSPEVALGVSPRGAVALQRAAQARAAMAGRDFATPDDVKVVVLPVLRHRIIVRASEPDAASKYLSQLLSTVPVPL
ncbi:MAG TPA: MoxR family ATPase [Dehalococcoidales bacterium]|nr:MoxR family ATPase [Dehalococcoidales bacterium]